jgi:diguanylate cyclase (GGDEF)-like protein
VISYESIFEWSDVMKVVNDLIIPFSFQSVFGGAGILGMEDKNQFNQEILEITRKRTKVVLILVILLQLSNLIVDAAVETHAQYQVIYRSSELILLTVSFTFYFLLTYTRRQAAYTRLISIYTCWALLLLGSAVFSYAEMAETGSVSNYILFMLSLGIVPIMRISTSIIYILLYLGLNLFIGIKLGLPPNLIQQIVLLAVFAFFSYWIQYSSSLNVYREKHRLKNANMTLERLSETDPLTGLLNRRGLQKAIGNSNGLRRQSDDRICLMMLDIDHFKDYNDRYMHLAGDSCLQKIARCLESCASRRLDIVARYGGDEFVIAVYNIPDEALLSFALKIGAAVRRMQIPFKLNEGICQITVSIGVAFRTIASTTPENGLLLKELLEEADRQLYNAKLNGRDCISYQGEIYH